MKVQFGDFKNVDVGEVPGGINILNRPNTMWDIAGYEGWMRNYNLPWIQRVINRGDDVYLASDPDDLYQLLETIPKNQTMTFPTITA